MEFQTQKEDLKMNQNSLKIIIKNINIKKKIMFVS
jgi:hypothetical protein